MSARRAARACRMGCPRPLRVVSDTAFGSKWDGPLAVWHKGERDSSIQDLRTMARMRHTGVPYADLGYIFGVSPAEARRCVELYVSLALGM